MFFQLVFGAKVVVPYAKIFKLELEKKQKTQNK